MNRTQAEEYKDLRSAALMETVDIIQRTQYLFLEAHKQAMQCAKMAAKMAVMVYHLDDDEAPPPLPQSQDVDWRARADAEIENVCAEIKGFAP